MFQRPCGGIIRYTLKIYENINWMNFFLQMTKKSFPGTNLERYMIH